MTFKQLPTIISDLNKLGIAIKNIDALNISTVGVNTGNLDAFRSAIKGLSTEQAVFALASKGATEEQIRQILITKQSEAADVEAALAKAGLTTATVALNGQEVIELAQRKGLTVERAKEIASNLGLIATEEGQVISKKQLTVATLKQAGATDAEIASILGLNTAETASIGITNLLTASFAKLWAIITAHPIGAILTAIGVAVVGIATAYSKYGDNDTVQGLQDLGKEGKVTAEMLDDPTYTDFINKLVEIGVIDSADNLDGIALAFNSVSTEAQDASDSVNDFSDGKTITTMAEAWKQLKASTDDSTKGVADGTYVKNVTSDTNGVAKSGSKSISSALKKVKNTKYKKALQNAQKAIKNKKAVLSSDLSVISKYSTYVYNRLYAYNVALENAETARMEYATALDDDLNPNALYDVDVVQFKYKKDYFTNEEDIRYRKNLIGFIAEDVYDKYKIAADWHVDDETGEVLVDAWNEQYMIPAMLKLIQEQHMEIEKLKQIIGGE